jgi:hypothetical protein
VVLPQVPTVEPGGTIHSVPRQQSPLIVHEPPAGSQVVAAQRSTPEESGTHGMTVPGALQQSKESAQVSPVFRHVPSP